MGVLMHLREGAIFGSKRSRPRTWPDTFGSRYTQRDSAGGRTGTVRMPIWVYYTLFAWGDLDPIQYTVFWPHSRSHPERHLDRFSRFARLTRDKCDFHLSTPCTTFGKRLLKYKGSHLWNRLPESLKYCWSSLLLYLKVAWWYFC